MKEFEYPEITQALIESPNNKAPRLNDIPTELYKALHKHFIKNKRKIYQVLI